MSINKPEITRLGTIDIAIVESTPIVLNDRLCLFQYIRKEYRHNTTDDSYFRVIDPDNGEIYSEFGAGLHLGSALCHNGSVYVFAIDRWGGQNIYLTESSDLKNWTTPRVVFSDPDMAAFNTSVCTGRNGTFIMACEQDRPEDEVGIRFTIFFLESDNLTKWTRCVHAPAFSPERYIACPTLRFVAGYYYLLALEGSYETLFVENIYRSKNLQEWEASPQNPVLAPHRLDRVFNCNNFSDEQKSAIRNALDINTSDIDLCEFRGETHIFYSWGNQKGNEFLARAISPVTLEIFLTRWFEC